MFNGLNLISYCRDYNLYRNVEQMNAPCILCAPKELFTLILWVMTLTLFNCPIRAINCNTVFQIHSSKGNRKNNVVANKKHNSVLLKWSLVNTVLL